MDFSYCYNCGESVGLTTTFPIDEELKRTWNISWQMTKVFNNREGLVCNNCGASKRAQSLAYGILKSKFGFHQKSLKDWVIIANKKNLRVCELNSCHKLHETLLALKNLTFAEYGTQSEEDIQNLSYKSDNFDLVLHSETLEHVSEPGVAMEECRRVLNQNGLVIFTIPIIWNRKTKQRVYMVNGDLRKVDEPSYHGYRTDDYLVFYEYGRDADRLLGSAVSEYNSSCQAYVFISKKSPIRTKLRHKIYYRFLENKATRSVK